MLNLLVPFVSMKISKRYRKWCKLREATFSNKSCGIHIHINAAPLKPHQLRNLVNIVAAKENMIYKVLKVSSRGKGDIAKRYVEFLES